MRKWLCFLLAALFLPLPVLFSGCAGQAGARVRDEYVIEAAYEDGTLTAAQEVLWHNRTGADAGYVLFDLYGNAYREGAKYAPVSRSFSASAYYAGRSYGNMEITSVSGVAGWEVCGEDENILRAEFSEPVPAGESARIRIEFTLTLAGVNHRTGIARRSVNLGNFYPVLCVYEEGAFAECVYDSCGDPFYSECADYSVTFTAGAQYAVAASGECVSATLSGAKKTYEYALENARDFAIVLGEDYTVLQTNACGVNVMYYHYADESAAATLQLIADAVTYFNDTFGKFPYKTYSAVQTGFCYGGMEYPALAMLSDSLSGEELGYTAVHETAHQWWYAAVGSDQRTYAWLDEGLAEYSSALFYGAHEGRGYTFSSLFEGARAAYNAFCSVQKQLFGGADTSMNRRLGEYSSELEYVNIAYHKGMMLFDSLRAAVGEKRFFAGLKNYYANFSGGIARPEHLAASFSGRAAKKAAQSVIRAYTAGEPSL